MQIEVLTHEVGQLADWQRGEASRREGERYERQMVLRARRLLGAGWGGKPADEPPLREWLEGRLETAGLEPVEEADPVLADLIWLKDNVLWPKFPWRPRGRRTPGPPRRAETLGTALGPSYRVILAVIGLHWAGDRVRQLARELNVEWYLEGEGSSAGLLELRRKP